MSANSKIEWTDHTFNPWIGCTKVSPACDHCYASVSTPARTMKIVWGVGQPRQRTSMANWNLPVRWNAQAEAFQAEHSRRQRVFCASLGDWLDNEVPIEWFVDQLDVVRRTPNLDWLLLSKRIGNFSKRMAEALDTFTSDDRPELHRFITMWMSGEDVPAHVWVGATICNQAEADRDIPKLLTVPARVRFVSMEPLLGLVNLRSIPMGEGEADCLKPDLWAEEIENWRDTSDTWEDDFEDWYGVAVGDAVGPMHARIDWVIVGGESGHQARPMHPQWARNLRDQCAAAGVPFLFKQWGEWTPGENVERQRGTVDTAFLCDDGWHIHPLNLATDDGHIDDEPDLYRVGKKAAGRQLDGVQHDGYPA